MSSSGPKISIVKPTEDLSEWDLKYILSNLNQYQKQGLTTLQLKFKTISKDACQSIKDQLQSPIAHVELDFHCACRDSVTALIEQLAQNASIQSCQISISSRGLKFEINDLEILKEYQPVEKLSAPADGKKTNKSVDQDEKHSDSESEPKLGTLTEELTGLLRDTSEGIQGVVSAIYQPSAALFASGYQQVTDGLANMSLGCIPSCSSQNLCGLGEEDGQDKPQHHKKNKME